MNPFVGSLGTKIYTKSRIIAFSQLVGFFCEWVGFRLIEAMKCKWIKRVSGVYMCRHEDKILFPDVEWQPVSLYFLECGCALYSQLANTSIGLTFLETEK